MRLSPLEGTTSNKVLIYFDMTGYEPFLVQKPLNE